MNGMALNQSCSFLKDHFQLPDALSVLIQEKTDRANSIYQKEVRFVNGFLEFYGQVIQKNLKTGVATNAHDLTVAVTEKALGLSKLFGQHIYSISCVDNKGKPDPAIYLHAADKLQIAPENCIAIEDSAHGLSAARKAGMFCIGINTSGRRTELAQAHRVIDEYHELDLDHLLHHPH
jgi:HAD superfamily hydrolase (TIGR01509 family)